MSWSIKHKSGRVLFVTSDEFIAENRRKMGWIVEEVKMTSREQFEAWLYQHRVMGINFNIVKFDVDGDIYYKSPNIQGQWLAWQASREAIEIEQLTALTTRDALDAGFTADYATGVEHGIQSMEKAIEQAGLKVKK